MINHKLRILVLKQLSKGPRAGYGLIKDIHERTGWKPSYGSVYPLLDQLRKEGLVAYERPEGRTRKKVYRLTEQGRTTLKEFRSHAKETMEELDKLHRLVMHVCGIKQDNRPMEEMVARLIDPDPAVKRIMKKSYEMKLEFARLFHAGAHRKHGTEILRLMDGLTAALKKMK